LGVLNARNERMDRMSWREHAVMVLAVSVAGVLTALLVGLVTGCAREDHRVVVPEERNCTTARNEADDGVEIECPDGTTTEVRDGERGDTGAAGSTGDRGGRGGVGPVGPSDPTGPMGEPGPAGPTSPVGANGPAGRDGDTGPSGSPGVDGRDGADAIVELIDPCGAQTAHDELLLRLTDGQLVAWLYGVGIIAVGEGTRQTSDGTGCQFSVDANLQVAW
jgi:hypothetical protein